MPRDRKSPADEPESGRGGAHKIAPVFPLVPNSVSAAQPLLSLAAVIRGEGRRFVLTHD